MGVSSVKKTKLKSTTKANQKKAVKKNQMKPTLVKKEILSVKIEEYSVDDQLLKQALKLKNERNLIQKRLAKMEAKKEDVSEKVYQKVHEDYQAQLNETQEKLKLKKDELFDEWQKLSAIRQKQQEVIHSHQEKLEEAKFRHDLEEFDTKTFQEIEKTEAEKIESYELGLAEIEVHLKAHSDLFDKEELSQRQSEIDQLKESQELSADTSFEEDTDGLAKEIEEPAEEYEDSTNNQTQAQEFDVKEDSFLDNNSDALDDDEVLTDSEDEDEFAKKDVLVTNNDDFEQKKSPEDGLSEPNSTKSGQKQDSQQIKTINNDIDDAPRQNNTSLAQFESSNDQELEEQDEAKTKVTSLASANNQKSKEDSQQTNNEEKSIKQKIQIGGNETENITHDGVPADADVTKIIPLSNEDQQQTEGAKLFDLAQNKDDKLGHDDEHDATKIIQDPFSAKQKEQETDSELDGKTIIRSLESIEKEADPSEDGSADKTAIYKSLQDENSPDDALTPLPSVHLSQELVEPVIESPISFQLEYIDSENDDPFETLVMGDHVSIGRAPSNDLVLQAPKVSRQHAAINKYKDQYIIIDLKSSNGVYVNGQKVDEHPLMDGDEISIGGYKMNLKKVVEND